MTAGPVATSLSAIRFDQTDEAFCEQFRVERGHGSLRVSARLFAGFWCQAKGLGDVAVPLLPGSGWIERPTVHVMNYENIYRLTGNRAKHEQPCSHRDVDDHARLVGKCRKGKITLIMVKGE